MAPSAHVVNVKVGASDGAVDVTQVIAAIDWVVEHKDDPNLNIGVLSLSFGFDSVQDSLFDFGLGHSTWLRLGTPHSTPEA